MHDIVVTGFSAAYIDHDTELPSGGWLAVTDGRVAALGGPADPRPPAKQVIDAQGQVLTPGLVNTHHHIFQNLTRSFGPAVNSSLFEWLTTLYPIWSRLDDEAVHWSSWVGTAELLLGGCTTTSDHFYVHPREGLMDAQIEAVRRTGIRFYANRGSMSKSRKDGFLPPDEAVQSSETILADSERVIEKFHDPKPGAMVRVALAPCSPFTVDEELMVETAGMAERYDVRLHTHLAEDGDEAAFCQETFGRSPVEHFEHVGWASPRTWVAHFAYPSADEAERLAHAGVSATHCPSSNMLICGATADTRNLRSIGMPVGIGVDGSASTDHASMWLETRNALLLARLKRGPQAMTARDALDMATRGSAANLGWSDEIGHLNVGALADLVIWQMSPFSLAGSGSDPIEALLRCGPATAWLTMVAGQVLVADGRLLNPDAPTALTEHARISRRLQALV
ncbi:MAG: 8-oxoguanine deaminase [Gordonia sp. (in: high G+C Gram-positive bacteria)]|uniref:8-oxoguanine deaminase n=1 Tax=Gordonia sp. (in: high G+C Gram-positive bacteria) TaxID=84139 RepID=UPI0039E63465